MELKLDQEALRPLVQKIVLDGMTPEAKDQLLLKAIASLFQPNERGYGSRTSPLEDIFADEVKKLAREQVAAELAKPENTQRVANAVTLAFSKVWEDPGKVEKIVQRMANALADVMVDKEYR